MESAAEYRKMRGKIEVSGEMECLTGLHIGASRENIEIGALDSPVVRDPKTNEPYIPGSSLKGKMRALLEKSQFDLFPNRDGGSGISRHECGGWNRGKNTNKNYGKEIEYPGALQCPVCRLFGSTGGGDGENYPARVKIRDLALKNRPDLEKIDTGLFLTEWKFENGIDRITSAANPRNIERVPKGAKFVFSILLDVEDKKTFREDLENLKLCMRLLEDDALGGHGSRGYGQVRLKIDRMKARPVDFYRGAAQEINLEKPEFSKETMDKLEKVFWP
jgi:CRISPR-associated protein Csm3